MKKAIGYKEFTSKKGNVCKILTVSEPFPVGMEKMYGVKVEDIFIPAECKLVVTPKDMNREVEVDYVIQGSYARVSDVRFK